MTVLTEPEWKDRAQTHRARLAPFVDAHLERRSRREKHPVHDFLFEYYSFRPAHLLRWSPGLGFELQGDIGQFESWKEWRNTPSGGVLDIHNFPIQRVEGLREALRILENTQKRAPFYGCNGLHEWAMVYRAEDVRHSSPLRLSHESIAELVESQPICCSHYDAFRFFTSDAVSFNVLQPQSDSRAEMEQPGCIHANMDLYKWAYKFYPWIGSELIADAFAVARLAREIDMRAAPYDLQNYGVVPIAIETVAGRREYQHHQREIGRRASPVRAQLIAAYRELLATVATLNGVCL